MTEHVGPTEHTKPLSLVSAPGLGEVQKEMERSKEEEGSGK